MIILFAFLDYTTTEHICAHIIAASFQCQQADGYIISFLSDEALSHKIQARGWIWKSSYGTLNEYRVPKTRQFIIEAGFSLS